MARAVAERGQHDHRRHADAHRQHRQQRAQAVAQRRREREAQDV